MHRLYVSEQFKERILLLVQGHVVVPSLPVVVRVHRVGLQIVPRCRIMIVADLGRVAKLDVHPFPLSILIPLVLGILDTSITYYPVALLALSGVESELMTYAAMEPFVRQTTADWDVKIVLLVDQPLRVHAADVLVDLLLHLDVDLSERLVIALSLLGGDQILEQLSLFLIEPFQLQNVEERR